jgi:hypothetical protein
MRLDTRTRAALRADNEKLQAEVDRLIQESWQHEQTRTKLKRQIIELRGGFPHAVRVAAKELFELAPRLLPEAASDPYGVTREAAQHRVREILSSIPDTG